jgi:hypothetical protein
LFLSSKNDKDKKEWGEGVFMALRAKSARSPDNPTVQGTMWSQRNGGRSTEVAAIMDSGCTHPFTTLTVTDAIKMDITPLTRELEIMEALLYRILYIYIRQVFLVLLCLVFIEAINMIIHGTLAILFDGQKNQINMIYMIPLQERVRKVSG